MKKILTVLKNTYLNFCVSTKMAVWYLVVFLFSMSLSWLVYYNLNYRFSIQKSADLSMQTLFSLKSNVSSMITNVKFNSLVIISNSVIQGILSDEENADAFISQKQVFTSLTLLINSMPSIESIYVFDNYGHCYGAGKQLTYSLKIKNIREAAWYKEVVALQGFSMLKLHANDIFLYRDPKSNVSLLRVINDTVSQKPIGILMMNISNSAFQDCYSEMVRQYGSSVVLLNESNECMINNDGLSTENIRKILSQNGGSNENPVILNVRGKRYIYSTVTMDTMKWKIIMGIPMEEIDQELSLYQKISLVVILINVFLLLGGIVIISRLITNPIHKLLESMKGVASGRFVKVGMQTGRDEIGQLKDGYNLMIMKIQGLLEKTVSDQKAKRKLELNVLQAQIKPHFLYNTLDAMGYLSLAGRNSELYDALEALGEYYRKSLSKGEEVISIGDEVNIARDYLLLQRLRYGELFSAHFEVDESLLSFKTPKLILQPLIENSIYHGIQPKGEPGDIWVRVHSYGDRILLTVEDNGIGMTKDGMEQIVNGKTNGESGFGLRGTIERLRLYYERDDIYTIESVKDRGTKISLRIPKEKAERNRGKNVGIESST